MAKPIRSKDTVVLNEPADKVREVLLDVSAYGQWWPRDMKVKPLKITGQKVGSAARIQFRGSSFAVRIVSFSNNRIVVEYYEGVQRGTGVWTIEALDEETTRVTYEIDLRPVGLLPSLLGQVMDYGKLHSSAMEELYEGLKSYLKSR